VKRERCVFNGAERFTSAFESLRFRFRFRLFPTLFVDLTVSYQLEHPYVDVKKLLAFSKPIRLVPYGYDTQTCYYTFTMHYTIKKSLCMLHCYTCIEQAGGESVSRFTGHDGGAIHYLFNREKSRT
jgi:hypothetical protein